MCSKLINGEISIRPVNIDDSRDIYNWEFAPSTRIWMRNKKKPSFKAHNKWLLSTMKKDNLQLLIAEIKKSEKVAVIRIDFFYCLKTIEIGITVRPDYRGKGIGKKTIKESIKYIKKNKIDYKKLNAMINTENKQSLSLFISCKFKKIKKNNGYFTLERLI